MANFTARFTAGVAIADWFDPAGARPSRLNNTTGIGPKYFQAIGGALVTAACTPDGLAEGAADGLLGGNLFTCWFAEWPGISAPPLVQAAGLSSVIQFNPIWYGHYLLVIYRPSGGGQCLRLNVGS